MESNRIDERLIDEDRWTVQLIASCIWKVQSLYGWCESKIQWTIGNCKNFNTPQQQQRWLWVKESDAFFCVNIKNAMMWKWKEEGKKLMEILKADDELFSSSLVE